MYQSRWDEFDLGAFSLKLKAATTKALQLGKGRLSGTNIEG
jgi:hypothetical protein